MVGLIYGETNRDKNSHWLHVLNERLSVSCIRGFLLKDDTFSLYFCGNSVVDCRPSRGCTVYVGLNVSYTAFPCEDLFKFSTGPPIMVFIFGLNIHTIGPHTTLSSFTYLILNILWKQPSASVAFVQASLLTHDGSMQHHHPAMSQIQRCPPWQESVAISALEHNPAHPCAQSRHIV